MKTQEVFYGRITKELYCGVVFFRTDLLQKKECCFCHCSELSRQRISDYIPEVPLSSVLKLLNPSIHKVYAAKQITFYFSSSPV